jgi:hypothetical protein
VRHNNSAIAKTKQPMTLCHKNGQCPSARCVAKFTSPKCHRRPAWLSGVDEYGLLAAKTGQIKGEHLTKNRGAGPFAARPGTSLPAPTQSATTIKRNAVNVAAAFVPMN